MPTTLLLAPFAVLAFAVGSCSSSLAAEDISQTLALLLDVKQIAVTWCISNAAFCPQPLAIIGRIQPPSIASSK